MATLKRRVVVQRSKARVAPPRPHEFITYLRNSAVALGFFFSAALLVLFVWLWRTGWVKETSEAITTSLLNLTRRAGFAVNDILVEGRSATDTNEILGQLAIEKGAPILGFDPHAALERLSAIPWVKSGVVERRLPNTLFVRLTEREPIAIWQIEKKLKLIDREGHMLREVGTDETLNLPLVVGAGAEKQAADLLGQLAAFPALAGHVRAATRISDRRWNLLLSHDITAKLPEDGLGAALEKLNQMVRDEAILDRAILGLDLRQPDRMIVETDKDIAPAKPLPAIAPPKM